MGQYIYYWNGRSQDSLPTSVSLFDRKKSDGNGLDLGRERMRHATINLSIDATGNGHAYPLGSSSRSVSEKKRRMD